LVNASGFASVKREGIEVEEGSERVVDVQLAIGQSSQTVLVNSEQADLDSATSEGTTDDGKMRCMEFTSFSKLDTDSLEPRYRVAIA
jgi:hypothetical protein